MTNLQLASACRLRISILDTLQSSVQIWHMSDKRPIDLKRDSAFSGSVGNDDEGDLKEFLNIGHTLLMIKENAIYKFQLADQIDPSRTNIDIPHVQQKVYSVGASRRWSGAS